MHNECKLYNYIVEPRLSNDSQDEQFWVRPKYLSKKMPQWSNKFSEFEHTSRADENGTRVNDCRNKLNTTKRLAESTLAAWFQFSNKSGVEYNFRTNYVWQPRFHYACVYVCPVDL